MFQKFTCQNKTPKNPIKLAKRQHMITVESRPLSPPINFTPLKLGHHEENQRDKQKDWNAKQKKSLLKSIKYFTWMLFTCKAYLDSRFQRNALNLTPPN